MTIKKLKKNGREFSSKHALKVFEEIREALAESNEDAVVFDGLEDALIGIGSRFGAGDVAVYDKALIIDIYMKRDGMSHEEAIEFFDFNVIGTGVDHSPIFVDILRK